MKYLLFNFILIFYFSAQAYELEEEESQVGVSNARMMDQSREALMSYDFIVERSNYLIYKIKKLTFGEYADQLLILAPLVSGNIEFQAHRDLNVFYNHSAGRGGLRYSINF